MEKHWPSDPTFLVPKISLTAPVSSDFGNPSAEPIEALLAKV